MTKSQLEYLNKFFPDDQMDDLIRIKNEINLLGEDDFANYVWETSRESFILDQINMDHNRLVKNMIYVIDYFKRVKEFNNVYKMFGFLSYFIEAFDKKNKLKNFSEYNLLNLYLSISSSLNPKYIDTTDDLLDFDTDLYDVMGRLIDIQYTILVRIKEKQRYKSDEYFFLPWSIMETEGYSDGLYIFSKMADWS